MSDVYKEATVDNVKVEIVHDNDGASNPRDWDNVGTMLCSHGRYTLGDKTFDSRDYSSWKEALRGEGGKESDIVFLPLYLYDHSMQSISTESFVGRAHHAEWDSGQVGWIYATKETIRKELGVNNVTKLVREKVLEILKAEVEVFDTYIRGDVYGVKVIELDEDGNEGEDEACWGFFGSDVEESGMADFIRSNIKDDAVYTKIIEELN